MSFLFLSLRKLPPLVCFVAIPIPVISGLAAQSSKAIPSYARDVRPFFVKYCLECHNAKSAKAGLDLETYKSLHEGSDRGPVFVAGKPDESLLVVLTEGKKKPTMPPQKASRHPKPAEVEVLRGWVAAGAKDDGGTVKVAIPEIKPRGTPAMPVRALAYIDSERSLVGAAKSLILVSAKTGQTISERTFEEEITAVALARDGVWAVAHGRPGVTGNITLLRLPNEKLGTISNAHQDVILDVEFSPDGSTLATCSYDTRIKLWDVATRKERHTLREHSDSVYDVSFSPDGKLLASGAADRAVKVWDVASGKLRYTLSEATDWVYAVAWHPAGDRLAAGGVDRSIRVWNTGAEKGRIAQSVFAHEGSITRLTYSNEGQTLYSVGEDRRVKAWDTSQMTERKLYDSQPDTPLALAVRPDGKQIAVARYDGVVALLDEATGRVQVELDLKKNKAPQPKAQTSATGKEKPSALKVTKIHPDSGQRGRTMQLAIEGTSLDRVQAISANFPGFRGKIHSEGRSTSSLRAEIGIPATTPAGVYQITVRGQNNESATAPFTVDFFAAALEQEPNDSPGQGQHISLPATMIGALSKTGDVDFFGFEAKKGQELGVQVVPGSKLDPVVQLTDASGKLLVQAAAGLLGHRFGQNGTYIISIRDRQLRGGPDFGYRLHLGEIPIVTSIYPQGVQRGRDTELLLEGVHLGPFTKRRFLAPADAPIGSKLPVNVATPLGPPLGNPQIIVGEFAEVTSAAPSPSGAVRGKIPVPGTANGILSQPGQQDLWSFRGRKGEHLIVEVQAQRLGSPVDSVIEILDARNQPIPRATLRSLARTFVTFRDHDSANVGLRIDAWDEFAVNDFVLVGNELLKIKELPPNPDADCVFFSDRGQRIGFLDTTPTHHSMGTPLYKVQLHPPGTKFPITGFPVVAVHYRNDDGGPGFGRDSRLTFAPPADGEYRVRIGDSRGQGGNDYGYRLTVRPPRPSFNVSFKPTSPAVFQGSAVPVAVAAERIDGFEDEIQLKLENLPPGFSAPATSIPAGENSTVFAFFAQPDAKTGKLEPLRLHATAKIAGEEVKKTAIGGVPSVVEPGDIVTTTDESEVVIKPGAQARISVQIQRRNKFKGRVPIEVRGLPHGVRVLDIGLNGILITEKESRRSIVLYAEPWVKATAHPFVVLARREGSNAEHAARSVLLRVVDERR